jgi:hypothetical protein
MMQKTHRDEPMLVTSHRSASLGRLRLKFANLQAVENGWDTTSRQTDEKDEGHAAEDVHSQPSDTYATPQPEGVWKLITRSIDGRHDG